MVLRPADDGCTMVQIGEAGWRESDRGFASAFGKCGGWTHMMACLKAWLEHGINRRDGGAT